MNGRTRVFASILRGSLLEAPRLLALAVAAIAIGTSVAAALVLVSRDVGAKVEHELAVFGPNLVLAPRAGDLPIGAGDLRLGAVGAAPRFGENARTWLAHERAEGRIAQFATLRYGLARRGEMSFVSGATDLAALAELHPAWRIRSGDAAADILVGQAAAAQLGVEHGAALTLELGGTGRSGRDVRSAGILERAARDRMVFVPRERSLRRPAVATDFTWARPRFGANRAVSQRGTARPRESKIGGTCAQSSTVGNGRPGDRPPLLS